MDLLVLLKILAATWVLRHRLSVVAFSILLRELMISKLVRSCGIWAIRIHEIRAHHSLDTCLWHALMINWGVVRVAEIMLVLGVLRLVTLRSVVRLFTAWVLSIRILRVVRISLRLRWVLVETWETGVLVRSCRLIWARRQVFLIKIGSWHSLCVLRNLIQILVSLRHTSPLYQPSLLQSCLICSQIIKLLISAWIIMFLVPFLPADLLAEK